jgi:hypothetical protein
MTGPSEQSKSRRRLAARGELGLERQHGPVPRPFAVLGRMGGKPQPSTGLFIRSTYWSRSARARTPILLAPASS